ncbi:MAG: valine--tRNA ligase [Puniceicoccales bacterium]|jgi:valyl-tRNA synthetase|nr:valine--tRNA ligase [Puniceicoccales bacterium]
MNELTKAFSPKNIEDKWYSKWLSNNCFDRIVDPSKQPFCIVIPPPNVTGVLHMGHLLNNTLQDLLIRYARHSGKSTLWIPGTDHAGISMQVRVEKELAKEGVNKSVIGREKFLEHACRWRDKHGGIILNQLRKLGVSCDWKNTKHTLDADYSRGVLTAFVELYNRGYVYRGKRMVNWCPVSLTALSDEEVKMVQQVSKLYYIKYDLVERSGEYIAVATTRPETISGDVAIAVNPSDDRYKNLVNLHCMRPLSDLAIPIIADNAVAKDFGTGALKITPAHDKIDFEIGRRHGLEVVDIFNPNGTLNKRGGKWCGMDRFAARTAIVDELKETGLLLKEEEYVNSIGISERGHVPVEPRLSEQWFLRYPKVEEAKAAVSEGVIKFFPEHWAKIYLHWLSNIQDWCISRQLWWGHRIPVWYKKNSDRSNNQNWHVSAAGPADKENWEQDDDVLDTWFSSWIWPFGVFGWPDRSKMTENGFDYFYPTDDLVTGPDIIFFWVARMIIAALELMGESKTSPLSLDEIENRIPFKNVYFTGIIRDSLGRKMSKSLGNSPEPLDLIEKYGADGLRLGLLMSAPYGQDISFDEERIAQGRNLCNKLWNAARFRLIHKTDYAKTNLKNLVNGIDSLEGDDHAILLQLIECKRSLDVHMMKYEITSAVQCVHKFFWSCYCDWYVEISKPRVQSGKRNALLVHDIIMRQILLMLNPFIPFITEELWHACEYGKGEAFIQCEYCETADDLLEIFAPLRLRKESLTEMEHKRNFVNSCRLLLSQNGHIPSKSVKVILNLRDTCNKILFSESVRNMLSVNSIEFTTLELSLSATVSDIGTIYIDTTDGTFAATSEARKDKILKKIDALDKLIAINKSKLNNANFIEKAPPNITAGARKLLEDNMKKKEVLEKILASL